MSWVAVAVAGGAILGAVVSNNNSNNAVSAQTHAADQANATQLGFYNQNRSDQTPWRLAGGSAINQLSYLLGLPGYGKGGGKPQDYTYQSFIDSPNNGLSALSLSGGMSGGYGDFLRRKAEWDAQQEKNALDASRGGPSDNSGGYDPMYGSLSRPFSMADFQQDPGYAFRFKQGLEALDRSGSAAGQSLSGAQLKALTEYGQGMGSQEFGNAYNRWNTNNTNTFNRLASVAGIGQTAANQVGQFGMNAANQIGSNQLGVGNAQAAGAIAQGNAWEGALNTGINGLQNQYYMSQLANGGWGNTSAAPTGATTPSPWG